ncbi:unnamed protein product [Soboliphyme baturini]|uniref:UPF0020 domain-containing protein n=1 Tax=Soboliphyme baturini TaxID=241478 RepID=A0A183I8T3_9BILA|nr:unnamed protein product [Soboliphyme baturini]
MYFEAPFLKRNFTVFRIGSILLPAAHFGARCFGADIEYNNIFGLGKSSRCNVRYRSRDETIRENFRQYGLEDKYVDMMIADTSRPGLIRSNMLFDCIVTDPPYGLREKGVKVGSNKGPNGNLNRMAEAHFPMKVRYRLKDVFLDLLNFAAEHLVVNGRLVYWLPFDASDFDEMFIPRHPCLETVATCEQLLSNSYGRLLVAMEKRRQSETSEKAYFIRDFYSSFRDRVLKCRVK